MPERITRQLVAVLEALTDDAVREWYGLEMMEATGLSSGTLYPILHRLVADGWLVRTREASSEVGGSGRRMYRLTGVGAQFASDLLASRSARTRNGTRRATPRTQPA
jgi:DNA-binding PadR family transcriptional regulator